ncbi:methyltransferase [Xylaria curta]|nr:methyltransferase [Xylaria curta]
MSTQTPSMSSEQTFRSFTVAAASNYAEFRPNYHPTLYSTLLKKHTSSGGKLDTLLDVGCGPGTAARALGTHFQHVIGLDPSEGMIASAIELGGTTGSGRPIRFTVSGAEDLSGIEDGSVDLLIAATAAHWFNLTSFWARAAQVLKPGGSVGLWTSKGSQFADSVPNVVAIREAVDAIQKDHLSGYYRHGSTLSRNLYVNLPMPWSVDPPVSGFDEGSLYRVEWGTGADNALPGDEFLAGGYIEGDLDTFEAMLGTTSTIVRWREDNKEKIGTEADVVRLQRREIERLLHEAGIEKGKEVLRGAEIGVLLMIKRV